MIKKIRSLVFCLWSLVLIGCLTLGCASPSGTSTTTSSTTTTTIAGGGTHGLTNVFFLHHSVGDGLVTGGDMRGTFNSYNSANGTSFAFWDHGYNSDGLRNASGVSTGTFYNIPNDDTNPEGLYALWTTNNSARTQIMTNHQVIAFKSCFPNSNIADAAALQQYKDWYLAMRDYFDLHTDKLFVVMSTPPLTPSETNSIQAANARAFANWLKSSTYLSGHSNVFCFDLFDYLAQADDGSADANMLKSSYRGADSADSHPNATANAYIGPIFAQFLINTALSY